MSAWHFGKGRRLSYQGHGVAVCGIAGIAAGANGLDLLPALGRMADAMAHRGPDEEGAYQSPDRTVALAHRRLKIIDLSSGQQPLANEDKTIVTVFNGEIYNFVSLRTQLVQKGHIFSSRSDTEVLVHLYEEHGPEMVTHLRGMFAFAIYDARDGSLFLARDRLGKKPLYYAATGGGFVFASELAALMASGLVPRALDPDGFDRFFALTYIPAPRTIFKAAGKIPPAHCLRWHRGSTKLWRYWDIDPAPRRRWPDAMEVKTEVRKKIEEAVRIRLVSDVPLGAFLSGGVDSGVVAACAVRALDRPLDTFSMGFPEKTHDERPYARLVARHLGTTHHEFEVEPRAVEILPELVRLFGEPYGDFSALPMWYLAEKTRQHVTVALSGDGGDELFGGYNSHRHFLRYAALHAALPRQVISLAQRILAAAFSQGTFRRRALRALELIGHGPGMLYADLNTFLKPRQRSEAFTDTLTGQLTGSALRELEELYDALAGEPLNRVLAADEKTFQVCQLAKVDAMTMAWSMEARTPLVDHELVELVFSLPPHLKIHGNTGKVLLKEIALDMLPADIVHRKKQGFTVPLSLWFKGSLREYATRQILDGPLLDTGWIRRSFLENVLTAHFQGACDQTYTLWNLLVMSQWLATRW